MRRVIGPLAIATIALASCSGGGRTAALPPGAVANPVVVPTAAATAGATTAGSLRIVIPARTTAASVRTSTRKPQFVSPATDSVAIVINNGAPEDVDVGLSSQYCTSSGSSLTCTIPILAPAGNDTFGITFYDSYGATGNVLGIGSATAAVTLGTPFSVMMTVDPAIVYAQSPTLTYGSGSSFVPGTPGSATLAFSLYDADFDLIPASPPSTFATALTVTSSDPHVTISPGTWTGQPLTLTYDGSSSVATTTYITVTAGSSQLAKAAVIPVGFVEYPIPTAASTPEEIKTGSDGAMWFTENAANKIGRITTAGVFSEYATSAGTPGPIVLGPDGAMWFAEITGNKIGTITTGGAITEYAVPTVGSTPEGIASGSDGALWFTENSGNKIGRVTTGGVFTEYGIPTAASQPAGIESGPDGALWFIENAANKIGRVTTSGVFTEYVIPTASSNSEQIRAGSDGTLWFTEFGVNKIGRITTAGAFTEYAVPTAASGPIGIAPGPDGAMWFSERTANKIARIDTSGSVSEFTVPTVGGTPTAMLAGPDGAVWFSESNGNKIGRFQ